MNKTLAEAILSIGSCPKVALITGIDRDRLDLIVGGYVDPTRKEQHALAAACGKTVRALFDQAEHIDGWHL